MNITFPAENITGESFVVQWDEVNDIFTVNYTVRCYRGDDVIGMASVDRLSYTVTGLTANTSYNVTVVAINTCCGAEPVSDVVMVITTDLPPTPGNITYVVIIYACNNNVLYLCTYFAAIHIAK